VSERERERERESRDSTRAYSVARHAAAAAAAAATLEVRAGGGHSGALLTVGAVVLSVIVPYHRRASTIIAMAGHGSAERPRAAESWSAVWGGRRRRNAMNSRLRRAVNSASYRHRR